MKLVKLSFIIAAALVAACSGADGKDGVNGANGKDGEPGKPGEAASGDDESSVSIVSPSKGILDREIEVSIGGSGTKFEDGAKPDFGPGIQVLEVTTSTPTLITAKLRIAKDAKIGPRAVKIGSLTAEKAFTVMPAIAVFGPGGKAATVEQGGLVELGIENLDSRAFDKEAFRLEAGDLLDLGSQANGPQAATGFLLAAPLSKPGTSQVVVSNLDASGKPQVSFLSASDALTIKPRTPALFNVGTPTEETFATSTETKLFKLTTSASEASIVDYRIEVAAGGTALPVAFVFGSKGTKDDRLGQVLPAQNPFTGQFNPPPYDLHVGLPVTPAAGDQYVVIANLTRQTGAKVKVTATSSPAAVVAEATEAHTPVAPQAVGAVTAESGRIVTAELAAETEVDAYKFTVDPSFAVQLTAQSDADLAIVLTKDPNVIEDPQGTPAAQRKVLGYLYPGKQFAAQRITAPVGVGEIYAVVQTDVQGAVKTGKYSIGMRKLP